MFGNLYSTDRYRRQIEKAKAKAEEVRDILQCVMLDMLDDAEDYALEHNEPFDDFTEDEDGNKRGIMYPENVAPELDNAIGFLDEAIQDLYKMLPKPN
jgi:hypothetical protein